MKKMIDQITPTKIISNYTRTTDKETELHRLISINDGLPRHFVKYILYDSKGLIVENTDFTIDVKA